MMSYWSSESWGSWIWMSAMMLVSAAVVIGLTVWVAVWATRSTTTRNTTARKSFETPRAVLDRRLAAGEIDTDEYTQARLLLDAGSAPHTNR